jgi:uncharacterized membrane protein YsdA (DUF1294 family)
MPDCKKLWTLKTLGGKMGGFSAVKALTINDYRKKAFDSLVWQKVWHQ